MYKINFGINRKFNHHQLTSIMYIHAWSRSHFIQSERIADKNRVSAAERVVCDKAESHPRKLLKRTGVIQQENKRRNKS